MVSADELLFRASVSARYHRRRAAFLERASSLMSVSILLGGATAFVGLVGDSTILAKIVGLFIVLVGVVQIVFQVDRSAAAHRQWLKRWNSIVRDIEQVVEPTAEQVRLWLEQRYDIESDCVAEMRALANDCYNRTMNAFKLKGDPFKITRWQRFWMQLVSFENASYS